MTYKVTQGYQKPRGSIEAICSALITKFVPQTRGIALYVALDPTTLNP